MRKRRLTEDPISLYDLPPPSITQWHVYAKARVVVGIAKKLLTLEDAVLYYGIEAYEFLDWRYLYEKEGLDGLRTTRIQAYRLEQERTLGFSQNATSIPPAKKVSLWRRDTEISLGPLTLVYKRHGNRNEVLYFGEEIRMWPTSIEILALLLKRRGRVVTKLEILKHLYGSNFARYDRKIIDVAVNKMRDAFGKKDASLTRTSIVVSIWGRGYALSSEFLKRYDKSRA